MKPINKLALELLEEYKKLLVLEGVLRSELGDTKIPIDGQAHRNALVSRRLYVDRHFEGIPQTLSDEAQPEVLLTEILNAVRAIPFE